MHYLLHASFRRHCSSTHSMLARHVVDIRRDTLRCSEMIVNPSVTLRKDVSVEAKRQ